MVDQTRKELADLGLNIRREVLGEEYVDKAMQSATDFNRSLHELVNEFCWGGCWGREGLSRKERSMITLAMATALGRTNEVGLHVRGGLNNGLTEKQISEVLLQTAIYCGVPAAIDSYRAAAKVLAENSENT